MRLHAGDARGYVTFLKIVQTSQVRVLPVISRLSYRAHRNVANKSRVREIRSVRAACAIDRCVHRDVDFLPMKSGVPGRASASSHERLLD